MKNGIGLSKQFAFSRKHGCKDHPWQLKIRPSKKAAAVVNVPCT